MQASDEVDFKFRIDSNWEIPNPDVFECVDDGLGGNNRYYVVEQGVNILERWYSDDMGN